MRGIIRNTFHKTAALTAIIAVIMLNFSAVIQCGSMLINDDCCHVTNTVKPCCAKNIKVTVTERFTNHCGCSMQETQQPADMYIDLSSIYKNNYSYSLIDIVYFNSYTSSIQNDIQTQNYSPPITAECDLYLTNMNLRI
jgi:hypothetical protein